VFTWITVALAAVALVLVVLTTLAKKFGLSFAFMTVALLAAVVTIFGGLFPNVINASKVTLRGDLLAGPDLVEVIAGTADLSGFNEAQLAALLPGGVLGDGADLTPLITNDLSSLDGTVEAAQGLGLDVEKISGTITGLPIYAAASTQKTLTLMTWVAVILTPIVLLYQGWSFWVFRRRIHADRIPADNGLVVTKE